MGEKEVPNNIRLSGLWENSVATPRKKIGKDGTHFFIVLINLMILH